MVDIKYANAYSEVLEIIKYISVEDYNKIPKTKIKLFKENANNNYTFNYSPEKNLEEQNISQIAKGIIAILFRDYWATTEQKEKILAKQKYDRIQIEKDKQKRYNHDKVFRNKAKTIKNIVNMVEYKESIFAKIKKWFKRIFLQIESLY